MRIHSHHSRSMSIRYRSHRYTNRADRRIRSQRSGDAARPIGCRRVHRDRRLPNEPGSDFSITHGQNQSRLARRQNPGWRWAPGSSPLGALTWITNQ
jgi:hypothetical protein